MSRGLSADNVAAATAAHVRPLFFVEFIFDGGTERLHNGLGDYTWGGFTWTGIGDLGEVSSIEEGDDLSPFGVTFKLNALDSVLLALAKSQEIYGRAVKVYLGFVGDDGLLVDDPDEFWSGRMETMTIELGGESDSIVVQAESELAIFKQANGRMFTNEDQQARYPGDQFFEYLDQMQDAKIQWGPGGERVVLPRESGSGRGPPDRNTVPQAGTR